MAIEHDPWHVSIGRDDLTRWCTERTLVVTIIKRWILRKVNRINNKQNNIINNYLIRPGAYPISGTELYPVSLLAAAMADVGGRGRVPLRSTLRGRDAYIP